MHHIVPLTPENIERPEIALAWGNLRFVCQDCHAAEHKSNVTERYRIDEDGNLLPPCRETRTEGKEPAGLGTFYPENAT